MTLSEWDISNLEKDVRELQNPKITAARKQMLELRCVETLMKLKYSYAIIDGKGEGSFQDKRNENDKVGYDGVVLWDTFCTCVERFGQAVDPVTGEVLSFLNLFERYMNKKGMAIRAERNKQDDNNKAKVAQMRDFLKLMAKKYQKQYNVRDFSALKREAVMARLTAWGASADEIAFAESILATSFMQGYYTATEDGKEICTADAGVADKYFAAEEQSYLLAELLQKLLADKEHDPLVQWFKCALVVLIIKNCGTDALSLADEFIDHDFAELYISRGYPEPCKDLLAEYFGVQPDTARKKLRSVSLWLPSGRKIS